jgi:diguanylate cyclase (GGDEF)-like protein
MRALPFPARPFIVPAAIVALAALGSWLGPPLPASLTGLRIGGPYVLLIAGLAVAWWFNRGRAFVILASLLGGFAALHLLPGKPAVYYAVVVLVPLNALTVVIRPERGARYRAAYVWLGLLGAEALLVVLLSTAGTSSGATAVPLVGRLAFAAAFAAALWRAWPELTPLQVGHAGALAAFYIAAEWAGAPNVFSAFMSAAGAILIVSLLQESYRLAFRDTLTGLPGRRALEERMRTLRDGYAIAMVDVDHFKQFNDTHGHDIGDQVLKLVAARLAEVGGGGIAYRYGGEEFSVLFPRAGLRDVLPHLEAMRDSIENYRMAVRAPGRPKRVEDGTPRRGAGGSEKHLSVTVSIGASGPDSTQSTPAQVIKAADEALYRAKQSGRNRVST